MKLTLRYILFNPVHENIIISTYNQDQNHGGILHSFPLGTRSLRSCVPFTLRAPLDVSCIFKGRLDLYLGLSKTCH